ILAVMDIHFGGPVCPAPRCGGIAPTVLVAGVIHLAFRLPVHQIGGGICREAVLGTPTGTVHIIPRTGVVINHIRIAKRYIQWVAERGWNMLCTCDERQYGARKESNYRIQVHELFILSSSI